jgi:transposase
MLLNGYQEILEPCFEIDIFRTGFQQLCNVIDQVVAEKKAKVLFIGMEPTGHYFENLARHLRSRYRHVRLVNTYAVRGCL